MFTPFGEILSVKIERDGKGDSKGFAFVCFADSDRAKESIETLNNRKMDNNLELYVGRFEKKSERTRKLKQEMGKNLNNDQNNKKTL